MNRDKIKNGAVNVCKGLGYAVGAICLGALTIANASIELEEEQKSGESFKNVMTAIVNSGLSGYYQRNIIEEIANTKLTSNQEEAIIAICNSQMGDYNKFSTIMNIID